MKKNLSPHISPAWHFPTALLSLLLMLFVPLGCADDDEAESGRATVKMIFTTRASAQADEQTQLADRERMKTLRVIMENANTGKILYNVFYDNLQNVTQKVITFQDVLVEDKDGTPFNFYAIANEASFLQGGESLDGKNIDLTYLYNRDLNIDFNITNLPLPQAKKNQKVILPVKETQTHIVQMEFPVAKVCVNFTNEIEAKQEIENIHIPGLKATGGKLFPQDFDPQGVVEETVPDAATNAEYIAFTPNPLPITPGTYGGPLGEGAVTPLYVYPAKSTTGNYLLNATWNGEKSLNLNGNGLLADGIRRGMQLNIGIALKYGVMQLSGLSVTVDNWNTATPIYPEFQ